MHHLDNDGGGTLNINFNCSASTGTVIDTIANMIEVCGSIGGGGDEWYNAQYYVNMRGDFTIIFRKCDDDQPTDGNGC